MGAGASADYKIQLKSASDADLAALVKDMKPDTMKKLQEAMAATDASKKPASGPPPMQKLDSPFGPLKETVAVDIKDDPSHQLRFEDDEGCVRVYEPMFDTPGQVSKVHYHDVFTAYLFLGNPEDTHPESAMEICQEIDGGLKSLMAVKMPAFPNGMCTCLFFPHPQFGTKVVHRVGIPKDFPASDKKFNQLGCEVKAWPKAATPEALPPKPEGPSLPAPYVIPPNGETSKFRAWKLELKPGAEVPAHSFAFPAMVLCGCGGGGSLKTAKGGPADSPLVGLSKGDYRWLPTGCAEVGPLQLAAEATEPFVALVIELLKEGLS